MNLEPQPLPPPVTFDLGQLPKEHIPTLLNSIICEESMGFRRELVGNEWQWTGRGLGGEVSHELFDFVQNDMLAFDMIGRFVDAQEPPLGFQIVRVPKIDLPAIGRQQPAMYQAWLLRIGPDGGGVPFAEVKGFRAGAVIALLVAGQLGVNLEARHRELFPGHYLKLSS
jgi:hypothetical protein